MSRLRPERAAQTTDAETESRKRVFQFEASAGFLKCGSQKGRPRHGG